jgi:hypothetical protein
MRAEAESPQAQRMALSLQNMRTEIAKWNAALHPIEDAGKVSGFEIVVDGKGYFFDSLRQIRTFMDDLVEGQVKNLAGLEMAGGQKGVAITHVGDGRIMTTDMIRGQQEVHPDLESAAKKVAETPDPAAGGRGLEAGEIAAPGSGGIPPSGSNARPPLDFVSHQQMPSRMERFAQTQKETMLQMQDAIKFPMFDSIWRPVIDGLIPRNIFQRPFIIQLRSALSGIKPSRYAAIQDVLLGGEKRSEVAEMVGMTRGELRAMRNMEHWYKELLGLDDEGLKVFLGEMKNSRLANGDPTRMSPDWTFPAQVHEILDDVFNGKVRLDDKNALTMAQEILMSIGNSRYMKEPLSRAHRTISMLGKKISEAEAAGADSQKVAALVQARAYAMDFVDRVHNNADVSAARVAKIVNESWIPKLQKLGLMREGEVSPQAIDQLTSSITAFLSGVAMSGRMALAVRNMSQWLLNAPKVGFGNTFMAMVEAVTPAGRQKVKDAQIASVPATFLLDELATVYPSMAQTILNIQRAGLVPYRAADYMNRAVSYLAGERAIRQNAKLVRDGKMDEFLYRTGLIGDARTVQTRVKRLFKNATPESWDATVNKVAHDYGKHMAEETQFVYNRINAPNMFQSWYGKFYGQFGLWGIGFAQYTRRNVGGFSRALIDLPGTAVSPIWQSKKTPLLKKYQRSFLLKQVVLRGLMASAGAATGISTHNWLMANPLTFEGGPPHQVIGDAVTMLGAGDEFDRRVASSNLHRFASENLFPWGAALHDWQEAQLEPDPRIAMLLRLGFNVKTTEDRLREMRRNP